MEMKACKPTSRKAALNNRPLITLRQAQTLESLFKTLASSTRLRMLHALSRTRGLSVGELADKLNMKPQAVSNQLQRLTDKGIVESQRDGIQIRYAVIDPCVLNLLHKGWCLAEDALERAYPQTGRAAS